MEISYISTKKMREGIEITKYSRSLTSTLKVIAKTNLEESNIDEGIDKINLFYDLNEQQVKESFESILSPKDFMENNDVPIETSTENNQSVNNKKIDEDETQQSIIEVKNLLQAYELTMSQKKLMDEILKILILIQERKFEIFNEIYPPIILTTGLPGTGKTFSIEVIEAMCNMMGIRTVIKTSFMGCTTININ